MNFAKCPKHEDSEFGSLNESQKREERETQRESEKRLFELSNRALFEKKSVSFVHPTIQTAKVTLEE